MKRLVTVRSPIALLAVLIIGAAPSAIKPAGPGSPSPAQPTATATATSEADLHPSAGPAEPVVAQGNPVTPEVAASAATYEIDWYSINGGGTVNASSANYKMGASIGQSVAGAASSASYQMGIGFWYGAGASGACACDCHADPACDLVVDILDVAQTVNVAFRGSPAIADPNLNCPYETTDVNCSGSTDVLDVVRMVNVAFRGFDEATEFCNPCP